MCVYTLSSRFPLSKEQRFFDKLTDTGGARWRGGNSYSKYLPKTSTAQKRIREKKRFRKIVCMVFSSLNRVRFRIPEQHQDHKQTHSSEVLYLQNKTNIKYQYRNNINKKLRNACNVLLCRMIFYYQI